jgi:penicillin amidase
VLNPSRGWIASANHRSIGSFYPIPMGLSTGSMGHTVRSWRLYEQLAAQERFTPNDVLSLHFDAVNPARRDIVLAGLHLRDKLKREPTPDAARALKHLEPWAARGATSDLSEPGSELAGEISTMFRFVTTPLAGKYGGGESGLVRFLRSLHARVAKDAKAEFDPDEQAFIGQALAGAWRSAQQRFGDDPARWNEAARAEVRKRRLETFGTLDGFGSLDRSADLLMPSLACVDGGTIKSQAAQSYTQYVPLDQVDSALSLLPPGHSERTDDPRRRSALQSWQRGTLHPAPLSRAAVDKIAAEVTVLSP